MAYFPISGVLSAILVLAGGESIEVATIGREGMFGEAALAGITRLPYQIVVQVPGEAFQISLADLQEASSRSSKIPELLASYRQYLTSAYSYSVACNGLHNVCQRCCRWLLASHDRVGEDRLHLTHEFLGIMLGVRRASVSTVLRPFA